MRRMFACLALAVASVAGRAESPEEFFESKIRPVLIEKCFECHSEKAGKSKGGLKLDSRAALLEGGDSGPAVIAEKPLESLLFQAIGRKSDKVSAMPPKGEGLSKQQLRDFEKWIADGAAFPGGASKADPKSHWAYRPIRQYPVPVNPSKWADSDVDRFLLAMMEAAKIEPSKDAAPEVVARRMSFALSGLPPKVEDLKAVRDGGKGALEKYADRLLASPHFGERWARHWMDGIRYADSAGHEYDYEIQGAWRYRDYLVRAFNADLPYDEFVREQVMGDLLPPRIVAGRNESSLGTGWWNLMEMAAAPVDLANDEAERLDNQLDTLGKAFNGLTLGCARCHDHKFDPIRTKEYYGLYGIAAASPAERTWANGPALDEIAAKLRKLRDAEDAKREPLPKLDVPELPSGKNGLLADFAEGIPEGWKTNGHLEVIDGKNANIRDVQPGLWSGLLSKKLPAYVRSPQFTVERDHIDILVSGKDSTVQVVVANLQIVRGPIYDNLKKRVDGDGFKIIRFDVARWKGQRFHIEIFTGTVDGESKVLNTTDTAKNRFGVRAIYHRDGGPAKVPPRAELAGSEAQAKEGRLELEKTIPAPERFLAVGEHAGRDLPVHARGDATKPKTEREPRKYLEIAGDPKAAKLGSGRRELAEALLSARNPLTARVVVNRVWHHLFGRGIVTTVDNFGVLGDKPSHPELLDFLAHRLTGEHRWSLKKLIREIVLSRAFQIESGPAPQADAENRLLSRFPLRRLDAESLRDAILSVSGELDPKLGGPSIPTPHTLARSGSDSGHNDPPNGPVDGDRRRSLYLATWRNFPAAFLEAFDRPPSTTAYGKRDVTSSPTQALALMNDPFVVGQAEAWGKRLSSVPGSVEDRVKGMYEAAFSRSPSEAESKRAATVAKSENGWKTLAMVIFNAKEFRYVP